jgi:hypothetical protein
MVPVERPKTNKKIASREKIRKWKTGLRPAFLAGIKPGYVIMHKVYFIGRLTNRWIGNLYALSLRQYNS